MSRKDRPQRLQDFRYYRDFEKMMNAFARDMDRQIEDAGLQGRARCVAKDTSFTVEVQFRADLKSADVIPGGSRIRKLYDRHALSCLATFIEERDLDVQIPQEADQRTYWRLLHELSKQEDGERLCDEFKARCEASFEPPLMSRCVTVKYDPDRPLGQMLRWEVIESGLVSEEDQKAGFLRKIGSWWKAAKDGVSESVKRKLYSRGAVSDVPLPDSPMHVDALFRAFAARYPLYSPKSLHMTDPEYESHKANQQAVAAFLEEAGYSRSGDLSRIMGHALKSLASQSGGRAEMRGGWGKKDKQIYRACCEIPLRDLMLYPDGAAACKDALMDIVRGVAQDEGLGDEIVWRAEKVLDRAVSMDFPPVPEHLAAVIGAGPGSVSVMNDIYEQIRDKFDAGRMPYLCGIDCVERGEPIPGMSLYVKSGFPGHEGKAYALGSAVTKDPADLSRRVAEALSRAFPKAYWKKAADFAFGKLVAHEMAQKAEAADGQDAADGQEAGTDEGIGADAAPAPAA